VTASYIAQFSGDGTYFLDQNGQPIFVVNDAIWCLLINAGRWSSGNWQSEISTYMASRAAQGYNLAEITAFSYPATGVWDFVYTDGRLWDGTWPFTTQMNPTTGMNNTYWQRLDYIIDQGAANGITVTFNATTAGVGNTTVQGWSTAQWTAYGTALGNRYKTKPNLLWNAGDDYFGGQDTGITAMRAAITAAGDSHPQTIMGYQETTSRTDIYTGAPYASGSSWAQYDWVYTYNVSYPGIIVANNESPRNPVIYADGQNYLYSGIDSTDALERRMLWWALSSGVAGIGTGDYNVSGWDSSGVQAIISSTGTFYINSMPIITTAFRALTGWWKLRPDSASHLVTGGRGTPTPPITSGGGGAYFTGDADGYVTAALATDGSLAVIYCAHAFSITINEAKVGGHGNYTAKWLDPHSGTTYTATTGTTYNSGAADGSKPVGNSDTNHPADWALILQGIEQPTPVLVGASMRRI